MAAEINDLPDEILVKILNHLDIKSLIKYRLVSKRFKRWIDTIKPTELIYGKEEYQQFITGKWFYTNDVVDQGNRFFRIDLGWFGSNLDISSLKRLRFDLMLDERDLEWVQKFLDCTRRLEHFEFMYSQTSSSTKLKLPDQLKILSISNYLRSRMEIDCDSLECLEVRGYGIKVSNPTKLKHLYVNRNFDLNHLIKFQNMATFHVPYNHPDPIIDRNFFENFKNLKELHLNPKMEGVVYDDALGYINDLLEQKRSMRKEIKFYFADRLIDGRFEDYFNRDDGIFKQKLLNLQQK